MEISQSMLLLLLQFCIAGGSLLVVFYKAGILKATYDLRDTALNKAMDEVKEEAKTLKLLVAAIPVMQNQLADIAKKNLSQFPVAIERLDGRLASIEDWRGSVRNMPAVRQPPRPSRPDPGEVK